MEKLDALKSMSLNLTDDTKKKAPSKLYCNGGSMVFGADYSISHSKSIGR